MATYTADNEGKVRIVLLAASGDQVSFGIAADGDRQFAPGATVEIDDARLDAVIERLTSGMMLGPFVRQDPVV